MLFPGNRYLQAFARHVWIRFLDSLEPGIPLPAAGPIKAAVQQYRRAWEAAPGNAEKNHDLGFALYLARDYASALPRLETAVRLEARLGTGSSQPRYGLMELETVWTGLDSCPFGWEFLGVAGAGAVVRALTANLSLVATPQRVRRQQPEFRRQAPRIPR